MLDSEKCEGDNRRGDATIVHWSHTYRKEPISFTMGLSMRLASESSIPFTALGTEAPNPT